MLDAGKRAKIKKEDFIEALNNAGIDTIITSLSDCNYLLAAILCGCVKEGHKTFVSNFLSTHFQYTETEISDYIRYLEKRIEQSPGKS